MTSNERGNFTILEAITVYCGSSSGKDPAHLEAARIFGAIIAREKIRLYWGGGGLGLMGGIAKSTIANGGEAFGFTLESVAQREPPVESANVTIVPDMHARKWSMFEHCSGLAVFPGGFGTLDEMFEILTWNQLGLHSKPVVLVNINGFWDPLLHLIDHLKKSGYIPPRIKCDCLYIVTNVIEILPTMRHHLNTQNVVNLQSAAG